MEGPDPERASVQGVGAAPPARPRLSRSRNHRMIAGICGGLARQWGWPIGRVRLLFVVASLLPILPGLPIYLLFWILVPLEEG